MTDDRTDDREAIEAVAKALEWCLRSQCRGEPQRVADVVLALNRETVAEDILAALRALGWQRVPPGSVVVPENPTQKMLNAAWNEGGPDSDAEATDIYRAMLAARPK